MELNRQQSQLEVRSFIERQRADARAKAEAMQRDIIRRINEANQNVLQYMDDRAQMKLSRLTDALNTFDQDATELKASLSSEQFLTAKRIIELRTKYASNMFDDRLNHDNDDDGEHEDDSSNVKVKRQYNQYPYYPQQQRYPLPPPGQPQYKESSEVDVQGSGCKGCGPRRDCQCPGKGAMGITGEFLSFCLITTSDIWLDILTRFIYLFIRSFVRLYFFFFLLLFRSTRFSRYTR